MKLFNIGVINLDYFQIKNIYQKQNVVTDKGDESKYRQNPYLH